MVWFLGAISLLSLIFIVILACKGDDIPDAILSLGSVAVGALAGVLVPSNNNIPDAGTPTIPTTPEPTIPDPISPTPPTPPGPYPISPIPPTPPDDSKPAGS